MVRYEWMNEWMNINYLINRVTNKHQEIKLILSQLSPLKRPQTAVESQSFAVLPKLCTTNAHLHNIQLSVKISWRTKLRSAVTQQHANKMDSCGPRFASPWAVAALRWCKTWFIHPYFSSAITHTHINKTVPQAPINEGHEIFTEFSFQRVHAVEMHSQICLWICSFSLNKWLNAKVSCCCS